MYIADGHEDEGEGIIRSHPRVHLGRLRHLRTTEMATKLSQMQEGGKKGGKYGLRDGRREGEGGRRGGEKERTERVI